MSTAHSSTKVTTSLTSVRPKMSFRSILEFAAAEQTIFPFFLTPPIEILEAPQDAVESVLNKS